MFLFKSLRFLSPDGTEGGGTAVAEPEMKASGADVGPELRPSGELYAESMRQQQGDVAAPPPPKKAEPVKASAKSEEQPPKKEDAKPAPSSALDAVFDEPPAHVEGKKDEVAPGKDEDWLGDIPEKLPSEGRSEHWARARGKLERQAGIIRELNEKSKAAPTELQQKLEEVSRQNEELQKLNDEYKDSMVALNVEFEPEHRKKFIDGRNALVGKAASKLNAFGGKGELIEEAMKMPESRARTTAINEALSDLEEGERIRVRQLIAQVEELDDEKAEIQKDPQTAWEKLKATETRRQQEAAKEAENYKKKIYDDTLQGIPDRVLLLRSVDPKIPGADEHNATRQKIIDGAWRLLGSGVTPQELAEKAFKAEAYDYAQTYLVTARKELRELSARLAEYEGAEPTFRGGKPPVKSEAEQALEKSPGELYAETMRNLRGGHEG